MRTTVLLFLCALHGATSALAVPPLPETVLYVNDFVGSDGDRPQDGPDWAVYSYGSNTAQVIGHRYEFRRVDSAGAGNAMFTGRYAPPGGAEWDAAAWTAYRIDTVMRTSNPSNHPGLVLRRSSSLGTINHIQGYLGWIRSHTEDGSPRIDLRIVKNYSDSSGSTGDASGTLLVSRTFAHAFQAHTDYRFSFEAVGRTLTLSLSDLEGTFLYSVTVTDEDQPHLAGRPGLRHRPGNTGQWTAWDRVSFTSLAPPFTGPFRCDAMSFYLVHRGGPLKATLRATAPGPTVGIGWGRSVHASVLAHLYDPDQRRIGTRYIRFGPDDAMEADLVFDAGPSPPGVYPLRYATTGTRNLLFDLATEPALFFGIQPRREPLSQAVAGQWARLYFFVPPDAASFRPELTAGTGCVYDPKGALAAEFGSSPVPDIQPGDGSLSEPFSSPEGGIPSGWRANLNPALGGATVAVDPQDALPALRMERTGSAAGNALVLYTGSDGPFHAGRAADVDASVTIHATHGNAHGLVARVQEPDELFLNFEGYHAFIQSGMLVLSRFDRVGWEGQNAYWRGHVLAEQALPADSPPARRLRLRAVGNLLEATVSAPGEEDGDEIVLASVAAADTTFSEGFLGFRVAFQANDRRAFFRDLRVLDPHPAPAVWRIELNMPSSRTQTFGQTGDFDAIFCPDPRTALAIRGSRFAAADGRAFSHRFQADMWDWICALGPDDIAMEPLPDLRPFEDAFAADPANQYLFGSWGVFSYLRYLVTHQTLANPMSGRPASLTLAAAYALDAPFNPFFGNERIRNRLLLSEFHRYLGLRQNDTERAGTLQLVANDLFSGDRTAFSLAAPLLADAALRELWLEGARRHVERYAFGRTSCENQSTHAALNLEALHRGSGDGLYRMLAQDWMTDLLDPVRNPYLRTGYLMEGYGPDSTYQGLAANQLAWYYHWTGDERVRDALEQIYALFNHTVAPEPTGAVYGASHFCHRTPGSWAGRQYGGGTLSMSPHLPGAAAWHPTLTPQDPAYRAAVAATIRSELKKYWYGSTVAPPATPSEYRFMTYYRHFPGHVLPGARLPMVESDRFVRLFEGEFLAVRRPAYYALVYVGKPDPDTVRIREGDLPDAIQRRTGGGLSLFWTPGFGHAVTSQNWHARTNQMPRADLADGRVDWPDYYTVEHAYDEAAGRLVVTSRMMWLPVRMTRRITFGEDALHQELEFFFEQAVSVDRLVEQIPFPWMAKMHQDGVPNIESRTGGTWTPGFTSGAVDGLRLTSGDTGASVVIDFPTPLSARLGPVTTGATGYAEKQVAGQRMGLIEVDLGTQFSQGQTLLLRYSLVPDPAPSAHVLSYAAFAGGWIQGPAVQSVGAGTSGTQVVAQADYGAVFDGWSDGLLSAARRETDVRNDLFVTAAFRSAGGVPIGWYAGHGLAPTPGGAWDDLDRMDLHGKGLTLREEFIADTDPNDPQDGFPVLVLERADDVLRLRLDRTSPLRVYLVDMKADLSDPVWSVLVEGPGTGGPWAREILPPEGAQGFFRARIALP